MFLRLIYRVTVYSVVNFTNFVSVLFVRLYIQAKYIGLGERCKCKVGPPSQVWWTALHQIAIPQFNNLSLTIYCFSGGLDPPLSLAETRSVRIYYERVKDVGVWLNVLE